MKIIDEENGYFVIYTPEEARDKFLALRKRIFDVSDGGVDETDPRIFRDDSWSRVVIRGSVLWSDRTDDSRAEAEEFGALAFDPRDELQPLFDMLVENGIEEIVHMRPWGNDEKQDAVVTRPTRSVMRSLLKDTFAMFDTDRVIFDRTGRWGFYGSVEMFGLLGGESEFMTHYIEKAGGMEFIRERADAYWQTEVDEDGWESKYVPHYYELAGWDNPPRKRESEQNQE